MDKRPCESSTRAADAQVIQVVVADDHPIVRSGITNELSRQPDIVVIGAVTNGDDALQVVRKLAPDVLVLDINMPGLPAVEVVCQVARLPKPTRTLILTAYGDLEYVLAMLKAGAQGYILKDEDPAMITAAVRSVAQGGIWLSAEVADSVLHHTLGETSPDAHGLSARELEVLRYLAEGKDNCQIGDALGISERTVRYHLRNIYDKLGVQRRGEAIAWAARQGLHKI